MPRKTFEIFNMIASVKSLRNRLAQRFGIKSDSSDANEKTVYAWGRPVASDEYPTGTGKPNPVDQLLKVMDIVNPFFPVEVQEIALIVSAHAKRLAMESGAEEAENPDSLLMAAMRKNLDVLEELEHAEQMDERRKRRLAKEWLEYETAFLKAKGCMREILNGFYEDPEKGEKR